MSKLDFNIGEVKLKTLIEIHLPISYELHDEHITRDLKITIDPNSEEYQHLNNKLKLSSDTFINIDQSDIVECMAISEHINNFIESILRLKYSEDKV